MHNRANYSNDDYEEEFAKESHLIKSFDVAGVVSELAQNYLLSIISSSPTRLIRPVLEREKILGHFSDVLGRDVHRSKHEKIQMIFAKHGLSPEECVMITDTTGDVREARLAGVDSIGVSWGFHELHRFDKVVTFRIVHQPKDIVPAVRDYFAN